MRREHAVPAVVAACVLLAALGQHQGGYFTFLRWVVTIAAIFVAWAGKIGRQPLVLTVFGLIAFLFNPVFPFFMDRGTWQVIDVVVAVLFIGVAFAELSPTSTAPPGASQGGPVARPYPSPVPREAPAVTDNMAPSARTPAAPPPPSPPAPPQPSVAPEDPRVTLVAHARSLLYLDDEEQAEAGRQLLRELAAGGEAPWRALALFELANELIDENWGGEPGEPPYIGDVDTALTYLQESAALGNTDAMVLLARLLADQVEPPDRDEALDWLQRAAARGSTSATDALGRAFEDEDPQTAEFWYRVGANTGEPGAMWVLGFFLQMNERYAEAVEWYERAAMAGADFAYRSLAECLALLDRAAEGKYWMRRAAEAGDSGAGDMIARGWPNDGTYQER